MADYHIDVTFDTYRGEVVLHVVDLDSDDRGPIASCSVGANLDSNALRDAWGRFHEERYEFDEQDAK